MIISIIKNDNTVILDGLGYDNLDLSSLDSNIHAIQFNTETNKGHIEFNDGSLNKEITSISDYQSIIDAHELQKTTKDADLKKVEDDRKVLEATYQYKRENEYPKIGDVIDAIFKKENGDSTEFDALATSREAIKTKYAKESN